jgi:hypothetical protein
MNVYRELFSSVVRTIVPSIVGFVMSWLATTEIVVDDSLSGNLSAALTVGFSALYYIVVRFLETKFSSKWGWLLGLASSPNYVKPLNMEQVEKNSDEFFKNNAVG